MNETILISLIIIFIYIFLFLNKNDVIYIETNTGTKFLVQNNEFKDVSAKLLSQIVENMYKIKNHLNTKIDKFPDYTEYIKLLDKNFNESRTVIYETDPKSDLTSYSVNKGEELSFCLKSKKDNNFHDINLLMYVAIHEMGHMACPEIGHGDLFKHVFKFITEQAIAIGVYNKIDYSQSPVEYCGMVLSSSIV
jgi:translation elongation factor EF-Ts